MVVDQDGQPLADAQVLQGGYSTEATWFTGADGRFNIQLRYAGMGTPAVIAAKEGYRNAGHEFYKLPTGEVTLQLRFVTPKDNITYVYGEPGDAKAPTTAYCGHCHNTLAGQFQTSAHARATRNPKLQDLYAGVASGYSTAASCQLAGGSWQLGLVPGSAADSSPKCYLGGGVLAALNAHCGGDNQPRCDDPAAPEAAAPTAFGACADCHAPGIDGVAGGRNLHDAVGVAFENGVHCDPCHKTADIDLNKPPGVGQRLVTRRPSDGFSDLPGAKLRPVMFGSLLDVANGAMGASLQPKFAEAVFCAGCHEQQQPALIAGDMLDNNRWPGGLPVHSTFSEWQAGPYNKAGVPCQHCHMPAEYSIDSTADLATAETASITFGFTRPAEQIRAHIFRGPLAPAQPGGSPRLIDTAVATKLTLSAVGKTLNADVTLGNVGCGHALPTGEPLRALVLLVQARCDGVPLAASGGMTLPDYVGARAQGSIGGGATVNGTALTWAEGAAQAKPGDSVRVVRFTGQYDDYNGVGFFANAALTAADKGLPIMQPVAGAEVVGVAGNVLTLSAPLALQAGDRVYLGDPLVAPEDGDRSAAWAGAAGYAFARVTVAADQRRFVPHYEAVDLASDNRIPPASASVTHHEFTLPNGCANASVQAWVLYRPHPYGLAEQRRWDAKDYLIATTSAALAP